MSLSSFRMAQRPVWCHFHPFQEVKTWEQDTVSRSK